MKKILLGTSTLISAAALFAGAAVAAETPKVTIGGTSTFEGAYVSEDQDSGLRDGSFLNRTYLNIKADAKTDSGIGYGAEIDLAVSGTNDADNQAGNGLTNGSQVNHSWVYVDGMWGRFEGGSTVGVTKTMKVDASSIARASGGIDGDFTYFMSQTPGFVPTALNGANPGRVIATPDLALDYGAGTAFQQYGDQTQEAINKVNYYTPRYAGFQAGVSFLFDTNSVNRGITVARTRNDLGQASKVVQAALNYDNKFGDVSLAAAATGEYGKTENELTNDLKDYNVGAKLGFMGFSVAGSYGHLGDSLNIKAIGSDDDTWYYTAGAAYETGPFGVSVTYLQSQVDLGGTNNRFHNLSVGTDYKLAPGLTPFAEVNFVQADPSTTLGNKATVVIAGTQLAF